MSWDPCELCGWMTEEGRGCTNEDCANWPGAALDVPPLTTAILKEEQQQEFRVPVIPNRKTRRLGARQAAARESAERQRKQAKDNEHEAKTKARRLAARKARKRSR